MRMRGGGPVLLGPSRGPGDELAVGVPRDDLDHGHRRQNAGPLQLAPRAGDQPVIGHVAQQRFQRDAVAALDAEGAGDLALAGFARSRLARKSRISCFEGSLPAFLRVWRELFVLATRFLATRGRGSSLPSPRRLLCSFLRSSARPCVAGFFLPGAFAAARRDERDRLVHGHLFGFAVLGERGVDLAVLDVRTVAAGQDLHLAAGSGCSPSSLITVGAAPPARCGGLLGQQAHGAIDADLEHLLGTAEARIFAVVLDVRPEAAEAGRDRLAVSGWRPISRGSDSSASARASSMLCGSVALGDRGALRLLSPFCSPSCT